MSDLITPPAPQATSAPNSNPTVPKDFFTVIAKEYGGRSMTLTHVEPLDGQSNYDSWASTMAAVWSTLGLHELVVEGVKPVDDASTEEKRSFKSLYTLAVGVYIQVVKSEIRQSILDKIDPHLMWIHLKMMYRRDTAYSLVYQLGNLYELKSVYNASQSITSFIEQFETQWFKLHKLSRESTDSDRREIAFFFEKDTIKRDFLLGFLARHKKNVVDNLTTKNNLSFSEVKQRLIDTDEVETSESAFLTTAEKRPKPLTKPSNISKKKVCNFCRKHHPSRASGHTWNNCRMLKEVKKQKAKENFRVSEEAHMTISSTDE
ncbi:hypothetical protein K3495_g16211, partial [Podosphaera aphanis]